MDIKNNQFVCSSFSLYTLHNGWTKCKRQLIHSASFDATEEYIDKAKQMTNIAKRKQDEEIF